MGKPAAKKGDKIVSATPGDVHIVQPPVGTPVPLPHPCKSDIKMKLAKQVIATFDGELNLKDYKDEYKEGLRKIIEAKVAGEEVVAGAGCLACHKLGENGNHGPGPELTHIAGQVPRAAIVRSVEIGPGIMPSYRDLPPKKLDELADFLASLD